MLPIAPCHLSFTYCHQAFMSFTSYKSDDKEIESLQNWCRSEKGFQFLLRELREAKRGLVDLVQPQKTTTQTSPKITMGDHYTPKPLKPNPNYTSNSNTSSTNSTTSTGMLSSTDAQIMVSACTMSDQYMRAHVPLPYLRVVVLEGL